MEKDKLSEIAEKAGFGGNQSKIMAIMLGNFAALVEENVKGDFSSKFNITVESAISNLVAALQESKGWMRDYADSIIRDAIDRNALVMPDDVSDMLDELRSSEHSMTRRGGLLAEAAEMIEQLSLERDALTKGLVGVADDKLAAQISKLRDGLIAAQESLTAIRRNNNILHYKTMTQEEARKGIIKVCEALEANYS